MALPTRSSYVRQNYHPECEAFVNHQISLHLYASYVYTSMSAFFDREDVALKHFGKFFRQRSCKEREYAEQLMWLQNQRGGCVRLQDICSPQSGEWESGLNALEQALRLARKVNQSLLDLHHMATEKKDAHLCSFLEQRYLQEQVMFIKELGDHITSLRKMGAPESGLAEYLFDKLTLGDSKKN